MYEHPIATATPSEPGEYSPVAAHVLDDPAAAFADLRARCPVHLSNDFAEPLYSIAATPDIMSVLSNTTLWSNQKGPGISKAGASNGDVQRDDPPEHTRRRRFLLEPFLPRSVEKTEPQLRVLAEGLADAIVARKSHNANLYADFALPLPVTSFCLSMGIEIEHRDQFSEWADEMVLGMTYPERGIEARKAINAFSSNEILRRREMAARGDELPEGFLSHLASAPYTDDGNVMDLREASNTVSQLLVAGHETTTSLITNMMWRLLSDRTRWERLLAERVLAPNAVEESLRFDPPVLGLCRTNNETTSLSGVEIPEDSKVMVLYASACRDPELFDAPDEFRLDRPLTETKRHLAFSWGIHHCLGAHVARLTARVALETLLTRIPTLRLNGDTKRIAAPFLWGRKVVPVTW